MPDLQQPNPATPANHTVPCAHCGLPAPPPISPENSTAYEPSFCCIGCEAIYHAIHSGGFDTFYKLREMGQRTTGQRTTINSGAAGNSTNLTGSDKHFTTFDSEEFLEQNSTLLDDGSRSIDLHLEGVHCAGCVWLTERLPHVVPGVLDARLSLARARLELRWHPDHTQLSTIAHWLTRYGYMPHALRSDRIKGHSQAERALLMRVGASWAIAGNIMILAVAMYGGLDLLHDPKLANFARYTSLALATASVIYGGGVFFRRAAASLRGVLSRSEGFAWNRLSMDVPIALGVFVGWAHSAWATITGTGDVWFDSIAVLIAALLTARWLQMRGRRYAGDAAERLLSLLPSTARRLHADQASTEEIPADKLQIGDLVQVRAGDVIPADGIITHGSSSVHRAVVTGESRPEPVAPGDPIEAGVTNLGALLTVRVTAAGDQTRVGKLMQWVEDGERRRAPIVQLADQLGGIFVLVVLAAAALTGIVWSFIDPAQAVAHVVALLVISCPCALGMATPLALTVGVGRAAKQGFFIKHDDVLQSLARATHIIFDKTGTLTEGRMTVAHITGDTHAAHAAARLEAHSNHPIATALTTWAAKPNKPNSPQPTPATEITEVPGHGITGFIDTVPTAVGHIDWITSLIQTAQNTPDNTIPPDETTKETENTWRQHVARIAADGLTPIVVAQNNKITAAIGIGDRLRPDARELINNLKARGIQPALLSGDHPQLVAACAQTLEIHPELTRGGVDPEQKRLFVEEIRQKHPHAQIVMVGDGVNDATALQAADVGIAVHGGTQAALVAADIFVTRQGIENILELIDGTHHVMRTVHRNLTGSAIYNAFGISLAALGFVAPLVAAIAMPISSLFVIASSLAQKSFHNPYSAATSFKDTPQSPSHRLDISNISKNTL